MWPMAPRNDCKLNYWCQVANSDTCVYIMYDPWNGYVLRLYLFCSLADLVVGINCFVMYSKCTSQGYVHIDDWHFITHISKYTGCNRRNGPDFGRVFLMLNYAENSQNTYILSWTVSEIMASEVWKFDSCYTLTDYQTHIETGRNMWFL